MPVNAPAEYFKAEERFKAAKSKEERIVALEEMIRLLPRHHGSEQMIAQLKSRLAKLRRESESKRGPKKTGIAKEGDAQVCLIGFTQSGKSTLLASLTGAKPRISPHPYTTTTPEIGMMDYMGVKVQLVEIPSSFRHEHLSIARTADLVVLVGDKERELKQLIEDNFVRTRSIAANPREHLPGDIKERIWKSLGLIVVYTKMKSKAVSPMALRKGSTVRDFALRIHKDFVANFRFARLWRHTAIKQVGLNYTLEHGDIVELHAK
ncbi:MAG: TGS domain-containing protein [Candidatus Aenigmarchaeota archaeon]|nr:TGS domain-containing protein [Candidatus Aenigmarchaeota archaeon]